jgi:hypothetical protein
MILARYEEVIRRRWAKMTTARRKEVLLKAWPDMPEPHRPDFEAYLRLGDEFKGANFRCLYVALYQRKYTTLIVPKTMCQEQWDVEIQCLDTLETMHNAELMLSACR